MNAPRTDIQVFHDSGVWRKPAGALAVDTVLIGPTSAPGEDPLTGADCYPADMLPDEVTVKVGDVGPPGTRGHVVIITHMLSPQMPGCERFPHEGWLV